MFGGLFFLELMPAA